VREGLIDLDGSRGEGGGQIVRTSLALSIITGRPFAMHHIRAGRAKPGLRRQHLTCVEAAAALCGAKLRGAKLGSQELVFEPAPTTPPPAIVIDIGTAGSTSLVIQTILVPAIAAGRPLRATVIGGTHNPMAPPFDFLDRVFVPHLRAMGADVTLSLDRHGFATGGAHRDSHDEVTSDRGQVVMEVRPGALRPLEIVDASPITARRAVAILARLPTHVADRELAIVRARLGLTVAECEVREVREGGPANVLLLEVERAGGNGHPCRELVTAFGERGLRAELVAQRACDELAAFLAADVPVGEHLADQLLLPMAVAGGGRFRTVPLSLHATTNIDTIAVFLDVPIRVESAAGSAVVTVG